MISDVFGLNAVYEKQTEKTWAEDPNFGYLGGGQPVPGPMSIVDRIEYSNDTVAAPAKGSLNTARA